MALIKCPECGQNISDQADTCIHCGYPLTEFKKELEQQRLIEEKQRQLFEKMTNTKCVVNNVTIDFSDALESMKKWDKEESMQKVLSAIENSELEDICLDDKLTLLKQIMFQYSIPESYTVKTNEEYQEALNNLNTITTCFLHYQKYDFEDEARNLYFKGRLKRKHINRIKELPILTYEEKQQFIELLETTHKIPFSFPEEWEDYVAVNGMATAEKYFDYNYEQVHMKKFTNNDQKQKPIIKPTKQTQPARNVPRCPTCGSTNIEKISTGKKAMGFLAVGILSSNARNTYNCKNCGYKW